MARPLNTRMVICTLAVTLIGLTAACSPLKRLQNIRENDHGDFRSDLALEYLSFAESEEELGHSDNSRYFAKKGLRAAQDDTLGPENPDTWNIEANTLPELHDARTRLQQVRSEFFQRVSPQNLARAQMLYDCWVMQSAKPDMDDTSLPCHSEFMAELSELEQIRNTLGDAPKIRLPAHYTIIYPNGGVALDNDAHFTIQEVLAITRLYPYYTIDITGHTDRVGTREDNMILSTKRAATVAAALVEAGIDPAHIGFSAEGEANPATPTLDGVARERNRRVEISVLPMFAAPTPKQFFDEGQGNAR